jgi:hypothetical protein
MTAPAVSVDTTSPPAAAQLDHGRRGRRTALGTSVVAAVALMQLAWVMLLLYGLYVLAT